jgi:phosphatidylserine/phosphatidylglycerophosphate/cardiolipin synthase-like enzyme
LLLDDVPSDGPAGLLAAPGARSDGVTGARTRILEPGVSCWRVAPADRVAVLIDAADYFQALLHGLRQARSRIMIVGWDFDPRVRLDPTDPATELRRLLPALLERRPDLHAHMLI